MDKLTRRSLLRALAAGALSVGTVVIARAPLAHARGTPEDADRSDVDVQARASQLEDGVRDPAGDAYAAFRNAFRNGGGGFGDGGFRNVFRNGGGFRNGGFRNGGFGNGGFRNGGGGFRNVFRNF
jgi:hypothetical protein